MEITLYKHAREVSLTLKSVLTFAFWVWGGGGRRRACSDASLGWLSGVRVCGGNFTSQMESDRINCARVNQSPARRRVFSLPAQETKQFELEGVVYTFYFVFVMTPFTILRQPESLHFLKFPADFRWNVFVLSLNISSRFAAALIFSLSTFLLIMPFLLSEVLSDNVLWMPSG